MNKIKATQQKKLSSVMDDVFPDLNHLGLEILVDSSSQILNFTTIQNYKMKVFSLILLNVKLYTNMHKLLYVANSSFLTKSVSENIQEDIPQMC